MPRRRQTPSAMICWFSLFYLSFLRAVCARWFLLLLSSLVAASFRRPASSFPVSRTQIRNSLLLRGWGLAAPLSPPRPVPNYPRALHVVVAMFLGGLLQDFLEILDRGGGEKSKQPQKNAEITKPRRRNQSPGRRGLRVPGICTSRNSALRNTPSVRRH